MSSQNLHVNHKAPNFTQNYIKKPCLHYCSTFWVLWEHYGLKYMYKAHGRLNWYLAETMPILYASYVDITRYILSNEPNFQSPTLIVDLKWWSKIHLCFIIVNNTVWFTSMYAVML